MGFIPTSLINKVAEKSLNYIPLVGPVVKFTKKAKNITDFADPIRATTRASGFLIEACTGPIIKMPIFCVLWASSGILGVATGNPALIAYSIGFADIILEEFI